MIDDFKTPNGKGSEGNKKLNNSIDKSLNENFITNESFEDSLSVSKFTTENIEVKPEPETNMPKKMDFKPKEPTKKKRIRLPKLSKKQWLIVAGVSLLLVSSLGILAWKIINKPEPKQVVQEVIVKEPEKPKEYISKLTGAKVSEPDSNLPVTAIMIENSPDARPQSGLKDAGVVYEAVAEGGITRFLTLFQESQPGYIGPIRSVRPYYLDWLVPFDAPVAHVGGSPEALAQISNEGIKDLDYGFNSNYYERISNRYAPHNVYTSRAKLLELQNSKGWSKSEFTGWPRKADTPSPTVNARTIDLNISSFLYNPHFDYDTNTNSYLRSQAGKPHVDEKSNAQISPKVVIAIVVPKSIHPDGVHTVYGTHGSGKAFVFQDGTVTIGTWEKSDRKSQISFKSADGKPIAINSGNTWISAVGVEGSVTYGP